MKSYHLLPTLLALTPLASAAASACLLAALGQQADPSDVGTVCGKDQQVDVLAKLVDFCSGDDLTAAYTQVSDVCAEKGIKFGMCCVLCFVEPVLGLQRVLKTGLRMFGADVVRVVSQQKTCPRRAPREAMARLKTVRRMRRAGWRRV
jgi:hypothetical protein